MCIYIYICIYMTIYYIPMYVYIHIFYRYIPDVYIYILC